MTTAAIGYVSLQGLGNLQACRETMNALVGEVRGFNASLSKRATNFRVSLMDDPDDAENDGLEPETYLPFTNGVFPMVYFSLTYDPQRLPEQQITDWEKKYDLKVIGSGVSKLNILDLDPPPTRTSTLEEILGFDVPPSPSPK
jgi:hypothetical protein